MEDVRRPLPNPQIKFLDQLRLFIRNRGLAYKTEKAYIYWVVRFIKFNGLRHPSTLNESHIQSFLTELSVKNQVSVNTQRLSLNALIFLYQQFLQIQLAPLQFRPARRG